MKKLSISVGQLFGERFLIMEKLGEGDVGQVYKAYDTQGREYVALKFLHPRIIAHPKSIERIWAEIRLARRMSHHNICRIYDLEKEDDVYYIKMEYIEGENLRDSLARLGPFTIKKVISVARQICQGLEEGHRTGVIHRALKPQNIMIDRQGNVRIMDFGITPPWRKKRVRLKPRFSEYSAPEHVAGQEADIRADLFSLGVILYELVTGRRPFRKISSLSDPNNLSPPEPPSPQEINPIVPDRLAHLILRLLEWNPGRRPQDIKTVLQELEILDRNIPSLEIFEVKDKRAMIFPLGVQSKWQRLVMILKERKIIHTLAVFIGGGAVIWEFVHWILIDHYHFPEGTLDITLVSIGGAMLVALIWQWFRGIRVPRKIKVEFFLIPVIIISSLYFDVLIFSNLTSYHQEESQPVQLSSFPGEWKNSIAVLPIRDLSLKKDQGIFCEGILDDVITKLRVQFPELKVLSKQAVMKYQESNYDIEEIGRELQVGLILETGLLVEGEKIRINSRLIDINDKSIIWAYPYEGSVGSIFKVQDEIARGISQKLNLHLFQAGANLIKAKEALDITAYKKYLNGTRLIELYYQTREERYFRFALQDFLEAIRLDKSFALAYWGLGNAYECRFNLRKEKEDYDFMHQYYLKAHEIAPDLPEANLGLGWSFFYQHKINQAFRSFARAQRMDPTNFDVNYDIASFLRSLGLYEQASVFYERALMINPTSAITYELGATCFINQSKYSHAEEYIQKGLRLQPDNYRFYILRARNYLRQSKHEDARIMLDMADQLHPGSRHVALGRAWLYASLGEKEKALDLLKVGSLLYEEMANIYALLGMKKEAIQAIKEGISRGMEELGENLFPYLYLFNNPSFSTLKEDNKFKSLLRTEQRRYEQYLQSLKMFNNKNLGGKK
ncbi:protein kinase [Candidatus Aminicenantes bacterium AC-334-K16]|jgi:TolB-like protein/Tfp pilus assembly protein PilF/predicted Ser/Thr protein kinase|nr:protein kinase [Candidatus Aminicenantes bacterium AC-334-K16]